MDHVLESLAGNPSAPEEVLRRIAADDGPWPHFWKRRTTPGFLRWLYDNGGSSARICVARHPQIPFELAEAIARPPVGMLHAVLAANRAVCAELVVSFADYRPVDETNPNRDPGGPLRAAIARRPDLPSHVYTALLTDTNPSVRDAALRHAPLSEDALLALAGQLWERLKIADRDDLPPKVLDALLTPLSDDANDEGEEELLLAEKLIGRRELSDDDRARLLDLLEHAPNTPMRHRRSLSQSPSLTWLPNVPLSERIAHASSPFWFMRAAVASGHDLPDELAERLRNDPDPDVVIEAHAHPSTPAAHLTKLVFSEPRPMGIQRFLRHPNFPIDRLAEMATGPDKWREDAACHPSTAPGLLVALTRDPIPSIARAAARNPALPLPHMNRLLVNAGR